MHVLQLKQTRAEAYAMYGSKVNEDGLNNVQMEVRRMGERSCMHVPGMGPSMGMHGVAWRLTNAVARALDVNLYHPSTRGWVNVHACNTEQGA